MNETAMNLMKLFPTELKKKPNKQEVRRKGRGKGDHSSVA